MLDRLVYEAQRATGTRETVAGDDPLCAVCDEVRAEAGDVVGDICEALLCAESDCLPEEYCDALTAAAAVFWAIAFFGDPVALALAELLTLLAALCYALPCGADDEQPWIEYGIYTAIPEPDECEGVACEYPTGECRATTVATYASETDNADENDYAEDTDHGDCRTTGSFDGVSSGGQRVDPATMVRARVQEEDWLASLTPLSWLRAPPELAENWEGFPFDAPGIHWFYTQVAAGNDGYFCNPPVTMTHDAPAYNAPSFLVMGLRPFVTYALIRADGDASECCDYSVRVRFWVGVTNHFSLFLDPTLAAEAEGLPTSQWPTPPYTTDDLPRELWNPAWSNPVYERGTLVEWWLACAHQLQVSLSWMEDDDSGATGEFGQSRTFYCDPASGPDANLYGYAYADEDGEPLPLCFSAPKIANDEDSALPIAFLGNVAWGDVCLVLPDGEGTTEARIHEAFKALFGNHVKARVKLDYWSGFDREGKDDPVDAQDPHELELDFCLRARDAIPLWQLRLELDELRSTPGGTWMFREWDVQRMEGHYAENATDGPDPSPACPCVD